MNYLTLVFPALLSLLIAALFLYYRKVMSGPGPGGYEWVRTYMGTALSFQYHKMTRKDLLPLALLLAVYSVVAFLNLGDNQAPESFHQFTTDSPNIVLELDEPSQVTNIEYYTGLYTGSYSLEFSPDGEVWFEHYIQDAYALDQSYDRLFKWQYVDLWNPAEVKLMRITARSLPMELGELVLYGADGQILSYSGPTELCDEQELAPMTPFWTNSTYFDEIYHARTAYEHIENVYPYEVSHPPLGKLIITLGIHIFGMNPFGWRFMGVLFGILMLIPFYILVKNIFGKTSLAFCGTMLFAFDFMHFVQTRIATIDTYGVFFILLSYLFMWRYVCTITDLDTPKKGLPGLGSLMLSGLAFGIGCACKWIVIYGGVGLAVLYTIALVLRGNALSRRYKRKEFWPFLLKTLAFSVLGFIIVPATIYVLSYIPYGLARGMSFPQMLLNGDYYGMVWNNQVFMLTYHSGVNATHPYSSRWWQWILDFRPILYFLEYGDTTKSAFGCFNNPFVAWAGLLSLIALGISIVRRRSGAALFIVVGYLSQLLPWVFITRITFAYHYFPSTLFLVLAICFVFNDLMERGKLKLVYAASGAATALFIPFYPVLTGIWFNTSYCHNFLKWFPSWPFG